MYEIVYTDQFLRSLRLCVRAGLDITVFKKVLDILQESGSLPVEYRPYRLKGKKYKGCWKCHIQPDCPLVWQQDDNVLRLILVDPGTPSGLFL